MRATYQAPSLQLIGPVSDLTLRPHHHHHGPSCSPSHPCEKTSNPISDGVDFQHNPVNLS